MRHKRPTSDAIEILHRRYYTGRPDRLAALERARVHAMIAHEIYALRKKAGLTQAQLAERVGTSVSAICRLEDADYGGHSLNLFLRVLAALNHRIEIRTLPMAGKAKIDKPVKRLQGSLKGIDTRLRDADRM